MSAVPVFTFTNTTPVHRSAHEVTDSTPEAEYTEAAAGSNSFTKDSIVRVGEIRADKTKTSGSPGIVKTQQLLVTNGPYTGTSSDAWGTDSVTTFDAATADTPASLVVRTGGARIGGGCRVQGGNLTVTGTVTSTGTISANAETSITAAGSISGASLTSTGAVSGASLSTTGAVSAGNGLTVVTGNATVTAGALNVGSASSISNAGALSTGSVSTTGAITAGNALTVTTGDLTVTGGAIKVGSGPAVTISNNGNLTVSGNITATGTITGSNTGGGGGGYFDTFSTLITANAGVTVATGDVKISTGKVSFGTGTPGCSLDLSSKTDAIALPSGTAAQQPSVPIAGMFRFNTSFNTPEVYNGSSWMPLYALMPIVYLNGTSTGAGSFSSWNPSAGISSDTGTGLPTPSVKVDPGAYCYINTAVTHTGVTLTCNLYLGASSSVNIVFGANSSGAGNQTSPTTSCPRLVAGTSGLGVANANGWTTAATSTNMGSGLNAGQWYAVKAIIYQAAIYVFIDGVLKGSSNLVSITSTYQYIGLLNSSASTNSCYFDNVNFYLGLF